MNVVNSFCLDKNKEVQEKTIREGARILSVCVMHESIYVFVEENDTDYNSEANTQKVEFVVFKNGRNFCIDDYEFLGTIVLDLGNSIYHVFYRNV